MAITLPELFHQFPRQAVIPSSHQGQHQTADQQAIAPPAAGDRFQHRHSRLRVASTHQAMADPHQNTTEQSAKLAFEALAPGWIDRAGFGLIAGRLRQDAHPIEVGQHRGCAGLIGLSRSPLQAWFQSWPFPR